MLADFLEGRLSDNERSQMENHLSDCETCLQELIIGKNLIRGENGSDLTEVPVEVTESAVRLINDLTLTPANSLKEKFNRVLERLRALQSSFVNLSTWGERRFAPVRGSKEMVSKDLMRLKKSFKEVDVEIEIEKTGESSACIRVRLLNKIKGVRVTLMQDKEREISSQLLNGNDVVFEDIPFGHYSLVFTRDGLKLGIYRFVIKETRHGRR